MKPTRLLIFSFLPILLFSVVLAFLRDQAGIFKILELLFWAVLLLLISIVALDAWFSRKISLVKVTRVLPQNFYVGESHKIGLKVEHNRSTICSVKIYDHYPDIWSASEIPLTVDLIPGKNTTVFYKVMASERGDAYFSAIEQIFTSYLGFWWIIHKEKTIDTVKVLPNFTQIIGAGITNIDHWINLIGARKSRRKGLGQSFHQLREYREGDTLKQVDWKATAKKHHLISKEYEDERDQQIVFLLDCGRNMRTKDGKLSHFDYVLNAMLLLTYTALRQNDAVGVLTFNEEIPRFIKPVKGTAQLGHIVRGLYDVMPTMYTSDYLKAADLLLSQQKRRALVILLTNLTNESEFELLSSLKHISGYHRLLVASLREEVLEQICDTPVYNYEEAICYAGTINYLHDLEALYQKLRANNIPLMNTHPKAFSAELISHYLQFKCDGLW